MHCSNWAALGTKDHCFFQSLILNEIYWVAVGCFFFFSLYSVALLVFYKYVLGVGGHRFCSPIVRGTILNGQLGYPRNKKKGAINNLGQNNPRASLWAWIVALAYPSTDGTQDTLSFLLRCIFPLAPENPGWSQRHQNCIVATWSIE